MKFVFFSLLILSVNIKADAQTIGSWCFSSKGLPVYQYTGKLPFSAVDKQGKDAEQPEDPFFLLGNYRSTLITHASGRYQFITAERVWARINGDDQTNYGWNEASLTFNNNKKEKEIVLTGINTIAANQALVKKLFGVGFARYSYQLPNSIQCTRTLSIKPSEKINTGNPSFIVTINIKNNGRQAQRLTYSEKMLVNYVPNRTQYTLAENRPIVYHANIAIDQQKKMAIARVDYKANTFLVIPDKGERFMHDIAPPSVFMVLKNDNPKDVSTLTAQKDTLASNIELVIKSNETKVFSVVIGLADVKNFDGIERQVMDLFAGAGSTLADDGLFAQQWKEKLPDLSKEKNEILRREMLWNAHVIEASAKYSEYYKETMIPQGSVYSYHYGDNISMRDHLQGALPACYTNPELAKSSIRYVIKHSDADGEIKRGNSGFGYTPPSIYKESDPQLYLFNTLAEYLLITKDYNFLNEKVTYYPAEDGKQDLLINRVKKYFIYLRDEVGTGSHGLVKMLNSDWSDSFFHKYSPNVYAGTAESHLNSAMVLAVFPKLIKALESSGNSNAKELIIAMENYRKSLDIAFMNDLGNRKFAARAFLNDNLKFGVDEVCIEPQGYLLQIPSLPIDRKKEIYEYVKRKISAPEKIGIRTRERPLWGRNPDGEDGGIWYSLEYPLLLGVASFDKEEAMALLMKFSFQNFATQYPDYWVGQWTAPDEINSTLYREGIYAFWVGVPNLKTAFQGYCSHPHTWPLFCYFKLKELK
ncbi:hypothetical protein EZ428_19190 [Pedobacter frigiditerrae]|uniref:Glycosyl hydrolase 94 catalytic domain-containing protein n=1 Tax=Pedobacter frigiditerrae TaxID=2530452 RepID=A0A4R0MPJ8_9SPHI|nr:hypothetical protein [Pedobacter frigiditerrae]TCC88758.1 hypothetical protein EZ428_19190 [Pedobacter frigiditerrae]